MKAGTKKLLLEAWAYCDEHDKSTEFMLQYMADVSGLTYDQVAEWIEENTETFYRQKSRETIFDQMFDPIQAIPADIVRQKVEEMHSQWVDDWNKQQEELAAKDKEIEKLSCAYADLDAELFECANNPNYVYDKPKQP